MSNHCGLTYIFLHFSYFCLNKYLSQMALNKYHCFCCCCIYFVAYVPASPGASPSSVNDLVRTHLYVMVHDCLVS